jgi:hypothetical protein
VLVKVCDEAYVLASLGKVLVGQSEDNVNRVLGYDDARAQEDPEKMPYHDVDIKGAKPHTVRLVSTYRPEGYLLHSHGVRVRQALGDHAEAPGALAHTSKVINDIPHIIEEFGEVPGVKFREFAAEFPHKHTQENDAFLKMFGVRRPS